MHGVVALGGIARSQVGREGRERGGGVRERERERERKRERMHMCVF